MCPIRLQVLPRNYTLQYCFHLLTAPAGRFINDCCVLFHLTGSVSEFISLNVVTLIAEPCHLGPAFLTNELAKVTFTMTFSSGLNAVLTALQVVGSLLYLEPL